MKQDTAILIADVFSLFHRNKKPIKYGGKGERVTIISKHGHVLIVEGLAGTLFPVKVSDLLMQ